MSSFKPLIMDAGVIKRLQSGDTLETPGETAFGYTYMSGFVSYGGSGNYYSTTTGGRFTVLRAGVGVIKGIPISWAGNEYVDLTANKGYWIGYSATNTLVAIDESTIVSADVETYYNNLYTMLRDNVILFGVWYNGAEWIIQKNNHPMNYSTAIGAHDHFRLGSVFLWTGAKITLLNAANRTVDRQGADLIDDHGVLGNVPDSTSSAISIIGIWKNASNQAQRYHRRNFVVSGVTTAPTAGAVYTHNGTTFTVLFTNTGKTLIEAWGSTWVNEPTASGTLTKVSGTGDASISFSSYTVNRVVPSSYLVASVPTPLGTSGATRYGIYAIYTYMDDMQTPSTAAPVPGQFALMSATAYVSASAAAASLGTGAGPDMTQFVMPAEIYVLEPVLIGFAITDGSTRAIAAYTGSGFVAGVRSYKQTPTSTFSGGAIAVTAAVNVLTDVTNFNGALSSADTDVQKALDTLDDAVIAQAKKYALVLG